MTNLDDLRQVTFIYFDIDRDLAEVFRVDTVMREQDRTDIEGLAFWHLKRLADLQISVLIKVKVTTPNNY
jgi:hypothetical protein